VSIVGVVPAAGYAERLQPLDRSKELLEIAGRPIMDYVVERMRAGGCSELRIVTRPEKHDVISYAERIGASLVLDHPETINESLAAGLAGLAPEDIALLGFPDSLWEPMDGYRLLLDAVEQGKDAALGLFDVSAGVPGSDCLTLDDSGNITGFHIKPEHPSSTWMWGCAAVRVRALAGLADVEWPSQHMDSVRRRGQLIGIPLSSAYVDIGTPQSLREAPTAWPTPSS
jgi:glucose-1-phosphate thymidylyltransferase